uniref:Uncharacterized protein n=1 Tax=Rhizophora mucronata TaxID=61149 RepID=A0A2P2KZ34_RHIMU
MLGISLDQAVFDSASSLYYQVSLGNLIYHNRSFCSCILAFRS